MAGSQSLENSFVTPRRRITSKSAKPKTGDGSTKGRRNVAMINSRNGSTTEQEGKRAATSSGAAKSPPDCLPSFGSPALKRRASQRPTPQKNKANPPRTSREKDKPARLTGILRMSAPEAPRVNTSTASTESKDPVRTASPMASKSSSKMNGQMTSEICGS